MPSSQSDWDAKHRLAADAPPAEPASIVSELLPLLPKGTALDIACGTGRHSLLLASRGQHVTAIDWSAAGLDILEARARVMKVPLGRSHTIHGRRKTSRSSIELVQADLENAALPQQAFDLILCIQYLQRSLFPQMSRALRSGGALLFETFTRAQLEFGGGPRNPAYLLEVGELREAFPELRVLFYRELRAGQGIASLLAQKPGNKN
ncbi:MAG TPA: class I SAM-dependent methyltransferase [Candidatus Acidoferrum sp.]|nr:class I SAM-dependent methyltransferase [Candidatus Acidoferrum sp.]